MSVNRFVIKYVELPDVNAAARREDAGVFGGLNGVFDGFYIEVSS